MQLLQNVLSFAPPSLTLLLILVLQSQHELVCDCQIGHFHELFELTLGALRLIDRQFRHFLGCLPSHTTTILLFTR